jgi:RND family efflux transporter MFP subunit
LAQRQAVIVSGAVVLTISGLIMAGSDRQAQTQVGAPASGSGIAPPASATERQYVDFVGRTEAVQTIEVRPAVPGLLARVAFQEGQDVRQGELLFEVDPRPHQAALYQAKAELTHAQAEIAGAEADLARQRQLSKTASLSQAETDQAAARLAAAKATAEAAKAKLESAQLSLESARITSPIAGRVGRAYLIVSGDNLTRGRQ